jgi:hypothetical protein
MEDLGFLFWIRSDGIERTSLQDPCPRFGEGLSLGYTTTSFGSNGDA